MDNVFIGSNTTILYNVRIGENVIIGANSLVNKDLESGYVYAGVPAKKIYRLDEFVARRKNQSYSFTVHNQNLTKEEKRMLGAVFSRCI